MMKQYTFIIIWLITPLLDAQEKDLDKFYKFFMYNEYDSARVFLQRKLQESPANPQFRYYLGKTYFALKQPAIRYYEKFLQLSRNTEQYPDMVEAAKHRLTKLKEQAFLSEYK